MSCNCQRLSVVLCHVERRFPDRFTERLLEHGNTMEILAFKRMVNAQVLQLVANVPSQHGISVNIRFDNSAEAFEQLLKQPNIGRLAFGIL